MEIANDRGAGDLSLQRSDQVGSTQGAAVLGQRDHSGELDAVHAHSDQRVHLDGDRGVRVGRHRRRPPTAMPPMTYLSEPPTSSPARRG